MPLAYAIIALISLCMVGICVAADKKRDVWLLLVFVAVSICNLGYFMLSVSRDLGAALNSNRISYLGSVFLPFFLLMMFWMLMRSLRHTVFNHVFPIGQWCWYAFYVSMTLIPLLCLFAAKHIGRPEGYRLPGKWYLMYIPSLALIVGILTNDLHQLAFRFHMGHEAGWDIYQRAVLYYAAVVWIFGCIAMMIAEVLKSCRIPGGAQDHLDARSHDRRCGCLYGPLCCGQQSVRLY